MRQDERFSKQERILKREEFRQIYHRGRRYHFPLFTIFALDNAQDVCRLGVTVTKRIGAAVVRNRCKRLLRETFRRNKRLFPVSIDIVVNVKHPMIKATYTEVNTQFQSFIGKLMSDEKASR
jgi:ribonuclease P protein component